MKTIFAIIVLIILVVIGVSVYKLEGGDAGMASSTPTVISTVTYGCAAGKSITAQYIQGVSTPGTADQPPVPGGSVIITLSDGRSMTLSQTISADGARYANADDSVVFWNKGNGIAFTENNQETYMGCMQIASDPGGLPNVYENGTEGFSLRYPMNYTVNEKYSYQAMGPTKTIGGIQFRIDPAITTGTNLGADSYLSVEEIPKATTCTADMFLDPSTTATSTTVIDGGTTYSMVSGTDAGAGNRYEETVYAISGTNPCIAIRYFIHYGVLENYPAGTVQAFDEAALKAQFDAIRHTLLIAH